MKKCSLLREKVEYQVVCTKDGREAGESEPGSVNMGV